MERIIAIFLKKDGEKNVLNIKRAALALALPSLSLLFIWAIINMEGEDTSYINSTNERIMADKEKPSAQSSMVESSVKFNIEEENKSALPETKKHKGAKRFLKKSKRINYRAKQVIVRKDDTGIRWAIPTGSNLIGQLLTSIDTREKGQIVKVLLPYGGSGQNRGKIPAETIFLGITSYPGKGKKVYINFTKAIFPNGKEFEIKASALNSKTFSKGLIGEHHSGASTRAMATMGLTMAAAMTDVLTEKEALGSGGMIITPKSTIKNAFYNGVSKISEMESSRQVAKINDQPEYVTIQAGKDLIISLSELFKGK